MSHAGSDRVVSFTACALFIILVVAGCETRRVVDVTEPDGGGDLPLAAPPAYAVTVLVVDENGAAVPGADYTLETGTNGTPSSSGSADTNGRIEIGSLDQPVLLVVDEPGFVPEPVLVDRESAGLELRVRLLRESGPLGERRVVMHFGGDGMLGRRYIVPTRSGTAVVTPGDGGASAREVVASIAPLFGAADVGSLNLETVVGTFPSAEAYPKKRFLLQSPPEAMHLLDELGVDLVTLGNNHARDWMDAGVRSTADALDAAGFRRVGGGSTESEAQELLFVDVAGYRIGFLSYTSVNGDFVNDSLPGGTVPVPQDLKASEAWQYEERAFGFAGAAVTIAVADRRIGDVWAIFKAEQDAAVIAGELGALWAAVDSVYPEMQDWVARRGHGGANPYDKDRIAPDVEALRAAGADLVVVQYHSGFQFQEVKSKLTEAASYRAIRAGADLVVCHHPHVLQGFEWYRGKLIAYSLGNFVFDQDFLATFPTVVLRVVFEENRLLQARAYPAVLDAYRPVPVSGRAARRIARTLHGRSVPDMRSERIDGAVRKVERPRDLEATVPRFVYERGTLRIDPSAASSQVGAFDLIAGAVIELDDSKLTRSRATDGSDLLGIDLGMDLFGWGSFEDHTADGRRAGGTHWSVGTESYRRIEVLPGGAPSGIRALRLVRSESNTTRVFARPVARVPFLRHQLWRDEPAGLVPIDGEPSYTLRFQARLTGDGQPLVRFDVYNFDDTNPTEDPESRLIRSRELSIDVPPDGEWHEILFDLPAVVLEGTGTLEANAHMFYMGLAPPEVGSAELLIDDLQFLQWRAAADLPDGVYPVDAIRGPSGTVTIERLGDEL